MRAFTKHIAWLFALIFVFLGAEKVNFGMEVSPCDLQGVYCPIANLYVYQPGLQKGADEENCGANQIDLSNTTLQVICETFFLGFDTNLQNALLESNTFKRKYFYKTVIHSTPYITVIDPPPIV